MLFFLFIFFLSINIFRSHSALEIRFFLKIAYFCNLGAGLKIHWSSYSWPYSLKPKRYFFFLIYSTSIWEEHILIWRRWGWMWSDICQYWYAKRSYWKFKDDDREAFTFVHLPFEFLWILFTASVFQHIVRKRWNDIIFSSYWQALTCLSNFN